MHSIHSSVLCMPLVLHRDSVKLPLTVPQSLEQLHMFPISDRDGCTGCSRLCCSLLSTFGCRFRCTFFLELGSDSPPPEGMDKGGGGLDMGGRGYNIYRKKGYGFSHSLISHLSNTVSSISLKYKWRFLEKFKI